MIVPRFVAGATAMLAVALVGVSACSRGSDAHASVSAAELQKTIIAKLAQAGTPSTWVNCPKDLPGEVGATTRCDVKFSSDNSVTALLTTTHVEGDRVDWEITGPELTKDQVANRVAGLTSAQSATCDSGLDGQTGDWVQCQVTRYGTTSAQTVEVKGVKGLTFDLGLTAMIPKQQLEDTVLTKVTPRYGRRPDSAECAGDLPGSMGAEIGCVVTVGDNPDRYVATVTAVSGGAIDFVVETPSAKKDEDVDKCPGCIG